MLETPTASGLTYMRFKGEASRLTQTTIILSFDIQAVIPALTNAVANVTKKVEVLESFLVNLFIGEFIHIVKRSVGVNKPAHLLVQTAFRVMSRRELWSNRF